MSRGLVALAALATAAPAAAQPATAPPAPLAPLVAQPATAAEPPPGCSPEGGLRFLCGQKGPEDLLPIAGTDWVLTSSRRGLGLVLINRRDRTTTRLYPAATTAESRQPTYRDCPGPLSGAEKANFDTHGVAARRLRAGSYTAYVIHHGSRESIEVFSLDLRRRTPTATWIGCIVAPDTAMLNSLAPLPDGGIVATNFRRRGPGEAESRARAQAGQISGDLQEWRPGSGWTRVPGSELSGPNGISLSPDGRWYYVGAWGSRSFVRLSRGAEPRRDSVPVGFRIDNVRVGADGMIYGAGQGNEATHVVRIDPERLTVTELLNRRDTPAFAGGTVAVPVGGDIWIGSYRGDRIAIIPNRH